MGCIVQIIHLKENMKYFSLTNRVQQCFGCLLIEIMFKTLEFMVMDAATLLFQIHLLRTTKSTSCSKIYSSVEASNLFEECSCIMNLQRISFYVDHVQDLGRPHNSFSYTRKLTFGSAMDHKDHQKPFKSKLSNTTRRRFIKESVRCIFNVIPMHIKSKFCTKITLTRSQKCIELTRR